MPAIITITDLNLPELDLFSRYSESQLYHINEPAPGIFIAESPNVIRRALNAGYEPVSVLIEDRQTDPWIPELFFRLPGPSRLYRSCLSSHKSHRLRTDTRTSLRHEAEADAFCGGDL